MFLLILAACALLFALGPLVIFLRNLPLYSGARTAVGQALGLRGPRRPAITCFDMRVQQSVQQSISILIPARNEEHSIAACVQAALACQHLDLEIIVLDDHSTDRTSSIVRQLAENDPRLKLFQAPPLPAGWCGKQFACWVAASLAAKPVLCFVDADVQLNPDGLARMVAAMHTRGATLLSGFPHQITQTPAEQLLIPLMHFLLLGFLPLDRMRQSLSPSLGAGCGQLMLAERDAYFKAGGHFKIRHSRHDGIQLPRAFRRSGLRTDLYDATSVAECRMYQNATEVVRGLLKNATEGIATPALIVPWSLLLLVGQVLPLPLLIYVLVSAQPRTLQTLFLTALVSSLLPRVIAAFRFRQSLLAAFFHPAAVLLFLAIQWLAFIRAKLGIRESWKGRTHAWAP
jgi:hypothetical protein